MRYALSTWVFVFVMIGVVIILWYVSQPTIQTLVDQTRTVARSMNANTTGYEEGITSLEWINVIWAPVFILLLLMFGYLVSSQQEGISYYER